MMTDQPSKPLSRQQSQQGPKRDSSVTNLPPGQRAAEVHHNLANKLLTTSPSVTQLKGDTGKLHHEGSAWSLSDYPDNNTVEVIERLSRSQYSLKELVELARDTDPEAFSRAKKNLADQQTPGKNRWSTTPVDVLAQEFNADLKKGLTDEIVAMNREKYGPNILEKGKRTPIWKLFLEQFKSFVVILLLVAAIVALAFREIAEGVTILIIVSINACLATYMEKSAGDALAKLASLAAPHCKCLRNGEFVEVDAVDLVPGDIVKLDIGDSIPADMRIIEVAELKANEAILTGESEDVKKSLVPKDPFVPCATNLCFASTSVTNGNSLNLVYATGMDTQVGKIAEQLAKESRGGSKLTPMQKGLNRLGGLIAVIAILVLIVVVIIAWLTKYKDPSHPDADPVLSIILVAVGFCVSSIPEGLPMVVTICLSLGCKDMVAKNANVCRLPAVETLGSCSVVCSDKTGTLTEGKMTAIKLVAICKNIGDTKKQQTDQKSKNMEHLATTFGFFPTKGFDPNGGIFLDNDLTTDIRNQIVHQWENGNFQDYDNIAPDYGNPENATTKGHMVRAICLAGFLNSTSVTLEKDKETLQWTTKGNMSEGAVVVAAAKARWSKIRSIGTDSTLTYPSIKELEVPFNSSRKMMATVHRLQQENYFDRIFLENPDGHSYPFAAMIKGAPDRVLQNVKYLLKDVDSARIEVDWSGTKFSADDSSYILSLNDQLSGNALRVLAFALVPLTSEDYVHLKSLEEADSRLAYLLNGPIVIIGLIGTLDPPRVGVKEAIEECTNAGVKVIMITGDQKTTAAAIGQSIGLIHKDYSFNGEDSEVVECSLLHQNCDASRPHISDPEFDALTARIRIFSRAQPEDKIAIVNSLKRQNEIVAMTGDGVNDAPALKAAHIGVAMGITGTDVAKGAAEMVLMDDNFCTIVSAIEEGRKIYGNIQKFVCFLLGTNIGEIMYLTISIAAGMKMPVEALQILFLNLMSDGCPAVALAREPADGDVMKLPPRNPKDHLMTRDWWLYGNIPHTIFEAACVIASLVVAMYLSTGAILVDDVNNQCKYVGDDTKYFHYCQSAEYVPGFRNPTDGAGFYTSIDYWDPSASQFKQLLKVLPGHPSHFLKPSDFSHLNLPSCDGDWCTPPSKSDVPKNYDWVTARGSRIATTQSFITAVYCEMLRAYTVRSWEFFLFVFNRNPWMHLACSLSAVSTLSITIIPGLRDVFGLRPIEWWQYLLAIGWAILNLILDELIPKPIYRAVLRKRKRIAHEKAMQNENLHHHTQIVDVIQTTNESSEPTSF